MSWVPRRRGINGFSMHLTLLPHLFLTSTLRERWSQVKTQEDSWDSQHPGLTSSQGPQQGCPLVLSDTHTGSFGGVEGRGMVFASPKLPRVLNAPSTHHKVFSPELLNRNLKSECFSHTVTICRNARRGGAATQQYFWREFPGEGRWNVRGSGTPSGPRQSLVPVPTLGSHHPPGSEPRLR